MKKRVQRSREFRPSDATLYGSLMEERVNILLHLPIKVKKDNFLYDGGFL